VDKSITVRTRNPTTHSTGQVASSAIREQQRPSTADQPADTTSSTLPVKTELGLE
jgi:hypothetical protein